MINDTRSIAIPKQGESSLTRSYPLNAHVDYQKFYQLPRDFQDCGCCCFMNDAEFCAQLPDASNITAVEYRYLNDNIRYHSVIKYNDGSIVKPDCIGFGHDKKVIIPIKNDTFLSRMFSIFR
jgi:hypothetical protein